MGMANVATTDKISGPEAYKILAIIQNINHESRAGRLSE